jgi:hypothetical protein
VLASGRRPGSPDARRDQPGSADTPTAARQATTGMGTGTGATTGAVATGSTSTVPSNPGATTTGAEAGSAQSSRPGGTVRLTDDQPDNGRPRPGST